MTERSYVELFGEFAKNHPKCLADLSALMKARIYEASRDIISANDDNIMKALRGEITICHEIVEGIASALAARESEATDEAHAGFPPLPT